uniref:KAT8 regulatory NSL complex subunit 2 n=1 Tax=Biomphalaria glabrata TaxID=6526 RepID=A0A2C9JTQ5_BIOGL
MQKVYKAPVVKAKEQPGVKDGSFCKYTHRVCMQNCMDGYEYCIRHILEDKTAPFKQCTFMTKSGKRCPVAAPKQDRKDGYCAEHAKKSVMARHKFARKRKPKETTESLLEELVSGNNGALEVANNEHRRGKSHSDSIAKYASSSDSESDLHLLDQLWRDDEDTDAESIDSDQEDILKYAGIYTAEEVAQILRDKLIRLQALYIDQFKRLKHVLFSKRREYLESFQSERDRYGSMKLYKNDIRQRSKYDKLCAMKRYRKKFGKEALLQKQATERRMQMTEGATTQSTAHYHKCVFVDEGLRCNSRVVPLSKFCQKHILHDPAQVLYRPCPFADSQCGRPVPVILNTDFCSLHQPVPLLQNVEHIEVEEDIKPKLENLHEGIDGPSHCSNISVPDNSPTLKEEVRLEVKDETEVSPPLSVDPTLSRGVLFTLGEEEEEADDGQAR